MLDKIRISLFIRQTVMTPSIKEKRNEIGTKDTTTGVVCGVS